MLSVLENNMQLIDWFTVALYMLATWVLWMDMTVWHP